MDTIRRIKEISDILHLAPSTLRYWDREGLLRFERDQDNQYRRFSFQSMMDICDIILYRSLAIPIRELKNLPTTGLPELEEVLETNKEKMLEKMAELQQTIVKIDNKLEMIRKIEALNEAGETLVTAQLAAVKEFRFQDEALVQRYLQAPDESVIVLRTDDAYQVHYGVFMDADEFILREKDPEARQYLQGLVKVETENTTQHNAAALIETARRQGFKTGMIIGRYLLTAGGDVRYDYYQALLEVFR